MWIFLIRSNLNLNRMVSIICQPMTSYNGIAIIVLTIIFIILIVTINQNNNVSITKYVEGAPNSIM